MSELSPQAQAVLDVYANTIKANPHGRWCENAIAAALRAVADQVVPEPPTWEIGVLSAADREVEIRREILAIADELENHQ